MKLLGLGSPDKVQPLSEKQAVELGADLLSEFFVFSTAVGIIIIEYVRQSKNKANKDTQMTNNIENLNTRNEQVLIDIEKNLKLLSSLKKSIDEHKNELKKIITRLDVIEKNQKSIKIVPSDKLKINDKKASSTKRTVENQPNLDVCNTNIYKVASEAIFSLTQKTI